jgi:hypothetical protein
MIDNNDLDSLLKSFKTFSKAPPPPLDKMPKKRYECTTCGKVDSLPCPNKGKHKMFLVMIGFQAVMILVGFGLLIYGNIQ